jgi:ABC-2 type transport system ATP-binding protein
MGPRRPIGTIRGVEEIVRERHSGRQATFLVRVDGPIVDPTWAVGRVTLEELLLAYISSERLQPRAAPERLPLRWHG